MNAPPFEISENFAAIGNCRMVRGDARDVLPLLTAYDCLADMLCTDSPYEMTKGGQPDAGGHKVMSGKFAKDKYDNKGQFFECVDWSEWMPLAYAALKDNADAYSMCNDKHLHPSEDAALKVGFKKHKTLTWEKHTVTPSQWYMQHQEYVHYFWKGRARPINNPGSRQRVRMAADGVTTHPCEKPVALMQFYISQSTDAGALVLDPFMGSGATGVAAALSGRQFIGIEKDPEYFAMAVGRITEAVEMMQGGGKKQMAMGGL